MGLEIGRRISTALDQLTPRERMVFEMKHYQGLKLRAIGEVLGHYGGNGEEFAVPRDAEIARATGRIAVSEQPHKEARPPLRGDRAVRRSLRLR